MHFYDSSNWSAKILKSYEGKNVPPNHLYLHQSVMKIYTFKIFQLKIHTINTEKVL